MILKILFNNINKFFSKDPYHYQLILKEYLMKKLNLMIFLNFHFKFLKFLYRNSRNFIMSTYLLRYFHAFFLFYKVKSSQILSHYINFVHFLKIR